MTRWIRRQAWVRLFILEACALSEPLSDACDSGQGVLRFGGTGHPFWVIAFRQVMETSKSYPPLWVCGDWLLHSVWDAGASSFYWGNPICGHDLARKSEYTLHAIHSLGSPCCQSCKCRLLVPPCYTPLITYLRASVYLSLKRGQGRGVKE